MKEEQAGKRRREDRNPGLALRIPVSTPFLLLALKIIALMTGILMSEKLGLHMSTYALSVCLLWLLRK